MLRIADRYVALQLLMPFFAWTLGLLVMIAGSLLFGILKQLGAVEVPVREIIVMVASKLPWGLVMSVPMAYAFAACLTVNRMSRDGEVTALRVGGVSPRRLSIPVIVMGFAFSLVALAVNEFMVPWASAKGRQATRAALFTQPSRLPRDNVLIQGPSGYLFYARSTSGERERKSLQQIMVLDHDEAGQQTITTAPGGTLESEAVSLHDVHEYAFDDRGRVASSSTRRARDVDLGRVLAELSAEQVPLEDLSARALAHQARLVSGSGGRTGEIRHNLHMKLAVPFASFAFALVAVPIIMRYTGSGFTGAMMAIGVIFVYYTLTAWGKVLSDAEQVNPIFGAWACNVLFGIVGGVLLWRSG